MSCVIQFSVIIAGIHMCICVHLCACACVLYAQVTPVTNVIREAGLLAFLLAELNMLVCKPGNTCIQVYTS